MQDAERHPGCHAVAAVFLRIVTLWVGDSSVGAPTRVLPIGNPVVQVRSPPRDVGPYEPVSHRPGPLFVRDPEVRLRLLVAADIDAVDELVDELFDDVGAAARQGPSELFARNAQLGGAR